MCLPLRELSGGRPAVRPDVASVATLTGFALATSLSPGGGVELLSGTPLFQLALVRVSAVARAV
ncbi:MAG: hypothetical protein RMJ30_06310 [Nitrososphaerota archaeon]|nr:hypothetical protein [Nitrososphaerota archaeon]